MRDRHQGTILFTAFLWLIGISVVIQLWLLAAALDALLAGHREVPVSAAIASLVLFLVNGGLLIFVLSFDRRIRRADDAKRK
ncbi:MAG: DUF6755 family protein [Isosphaeraceae bacterium]